MQPAKLAHQTVLPNLDALRFFAFFGVMCAHAFEPLVPHESDAAYLSFYSFMDYGVLGVNFFFVLSGFLITRILLDDVAVANKLRAGRFYVRRMLRIWPLYFFMLALSAIYYYIRRMPDTNTHWLYYFLFLGNYHIIVHGYPAIPALGYLWSIAVEEQFYFVWPLLLWVFRKHALWLSVAVITVSLAFRYWVVITAHQTHFQLYFNSLSVMNDIGIGALVACLTQRFNANSVVLPSWFSPVVFVGLLALDVLFEAVPLVKPFVPWNRLVVSSLFGWIVFHQVFVSNRSVNVQAVPGTSYLGKISYGLYVYHAFTGLFARYMFDKLGVDLHGVVAVVVYPLTMLCVTAAVAALSYELVEKRILRLKNVWAR